MKGVVVLRAIIGFGERGQRQDLVALQRRLALPFCMVWGSVDTRSLNSYDGHIFSTYCLFTLRSVTRCNIAVESCIS